MNTLQEIRDVFALLHDGTIEAYSGDARRLRLTISCPYLAERIASGFVFFYVELTDVSTLNLEVWADNEPVRHELTAVFEGELEVNNATVMSDCVLVTCYQFDPAVPYRGGNLRLACATTQVFDQANNLLTVVELKQLATDYWRDWKHRNQR